MRLSLIAARSENNVIGAGSVIPWHVRGEQLLFKAMTFNQWLLVGRKTFEAMGILPDRRYAVVSRSGIVSNVQGVLVFSSIETALEKMPEYTDHLFISGGGEIYRRLIDRADILHVSTIHREVDGDVYFPAIPAAFEICFSQRFLSNIDYTYEIFRKRR